VLAIKREDVGYVMAFAGDYQRSIGKIHGQGVVFILQLKNAIKGRLIQGHEFYPQRLNEIQNFLSVPPVVGEEPEDFG
jgi:hypothetical protein